MGTDKQKKSFYFPQEMLEEVHTEGERLQRSASWLVNYAWKLAIEEIRKIPAPDDAV